MAQSVAAIAAAILQALNPRVIVQRFVSRLLDVNTSQSDFVAINTREVSFAADAGLHSTVQSVVPDVQFPDHRGINGGNEITSVLCRRHDEFVGADSIETR